MIETNLLTSVGTDYLSPEDHQQLQQWNGSLPAPVDANYHRLVHQRCQEMPDRLAIRSWDGELTYRELDQQSSALASVLGRRHEDKLSPGNTFPIYAEKSRWVVVAILAVLKIRGAFILLDVNHPVERWRAVCRDAAATTILASAAQAANAATLKENIAVITIQQISTSSSDASDLHNGACVDYCKPSDPMYMIYTSGTTGTPKGAVVSHSAFMTMATNILPMVYIDQHSRVLQFSSFGFDACLGELLLPLLVGGCVCIPSEADRTDRLYEFIQRTEVNWAGMTPSMARVMDPQRLPSIKCVAFMGEAITQPVVDRWAPYVENILGLYGPSECAVYTTIQTDLRQSPHPANLGNPFASRCWIVDPNNYNILLPIGAEGELLIEGPGVGEYYLNRPDLTTASFVEKPDWLSAGGSTKNGKFYRTGDLARYHVEDGSVQYLGRKDTQVKLCGQRMELGEIEAQLRCYWPEAPDIVAEVVLINGKIATLAAFINVQFSATTQTSTGELLVVPASSHFRQQIQQVEALLHATLPKYMIPMYYFPVTTIPMTASFKTDRLRLRKEATQISQKKLGQYRVGGSEILMHPEPIMPRESMLRKLWAETLQIDPGNIGRGDGWFNMGGNSLLAMKFIDDARTQYGLRLSLQSLYQYPTLAKLAEVTEEETPAMATEMPVPFSLLDDQAREVICHKVSDKYGPDGVEDIYPCTYMQKEDIKMAMAGKYNFTMGFDFHLPPEMDHERVSFAWRELLGAHPILRAQMVEVKGDYFQAIVTSPTTVEQLDAFPSHGYDMWGLYRPLARLLILEKSNRYLVLLHHTIYDGYSIGVVFQHLEKALRHQPIPARPFSKFVQWISHRDPQVDEYWKDLLNDFVGPAFPALPHPAYEPQEAIWVDQHIPRPSQALKTLTLDAIMRFALAVAISCASGSTDVVFGTYVNRRGVALPGITNMAGPLLSIVPVRIKLDGSKSLLTSLQETEQSSVATTAYLSVELDQIRQLGPGPQKACSFQTWLVVQPDFFANVPDLFSQFRCWEEAMGNCNLGIVPILHPDSIQLTAGYDEKMVSGRTVQFMMERMAKVLQVADQAPTTPVRELLAKFDSEECCQ